MAVSVELRKEDVRRPSTEFASLSQLLAGGVAGAVAKTCTAPLARLTILFQVQGMKPDHDFLHKSSMLRESGRIIRQEGFSAFWKGNGVTVVHRFPYSAINFLAYENYKTELFKSLGLEENEKDRQMARSLSRFLAGGGSGVTAAMVTYPLDVVRTRLAAQTTSRDYSGILHTLITIQKQEGFLGLYKGLWPTLLTVGPQLAINFCLHDTLMERWISERPETPKAVVDLICGGISGVAGSTVLFPIDLVKRRMQLEGDARWKPVYQSGITSTLRHIVRTEGYRGLYRGILPEYLKVFPGVGIAFMVYEFMKSLVTSTSNRSFVASYVAGILWLYGGKEIKLS